MKISGCFFTAVISVTIIVGILFYLGKKYSPEIWEFGKERLLTAVKDDINEKIDSLEANEYKDSLVVLVNSQLKRMEKLSFDEMEKDSIQFFENLEKFIKDNKIDRNEIHTLTELFEQYEK